MSPASVPAATLGELPRALAERRGDAEALVVPAFAHGGQALRLSARQLEQQVDDLARGLLAAGVQAGEAVALWAANVPAWVPLQFALARVGAVLVTLHTALAAEEVAYVLGHSGATTVLHTTRTGSHEASALLDDLLARRACALSGVRRRVWLPSGPGDALPDSSGPLPPRPLDALLAQGRHASPRAVREREARCREQDLAHIQYTSGTTGRPKGVRLSHRNLLSSGRTLGDSLLLAPQDRVALMVPLFHCFGCVVCVLGAFTHGATLCTLERFDAGQVLRLVEAERISVLNGVPTMFDALLAHPDRQRRDLSSLRCGLVAGSACPESLMRAIVADLPCPGALAGYGLTEASPGVAGSRPDDPLEQRCTTVGRALPGVQLRLVDPLSERDVPDGQQGEIRVRGPNVMLGYHGEARATREALGDDGWLRTGDLGLRGGDGLLRVVGRCKDIIIRGGENIAPAAIEAALREHPDLAAVAVVGVPHPRLGEEVAAALVLRAGARLDPPSYERHLAGRVAAFCVPGLWRAFDSFPLTGSGKVRKHLLRDVLVREPSAACEPGADP